MKKRLFIPVLLSSLGVFCLLAYQNFTWSGEILVTGEKALISKIETQAHEHTRTSVLTTKDLTAQKTHEAKRTGFGVMPEIVSASDRAKSYMKFSINNPRGEVLPLNDRSEIRLINSHFDFENELNKPNIYYSAFKFFIPEQDGKTAITPITPQEWALIWQCAQVEGNPRFPDGTLKPGKSPPISLHISGHKLVVATKQNFNSKLKADDYQDIAQLQRGRWYSVTMRYQMGANGGYALWLDGIPVQMKVGTRTVTSKYLPIGYKDVFVDKAETIKNCRVSFGLYKKATKGFFQIYFMNMYLGEDYRRPL